MAFDEHDWNTILESPEYRDFLCSPEFWESPDDDWQAGWRRYLYRTDPLYADAVLRHFRRNGGTEGFRTWAFENDLDPRTAYAGAAGSVSRWRAVRRAKRTGDKVPLAVQKSIDEVVDQRGERSAPEPGPLDWKRSKRAVDIRTDGRGNPRAVSVTEAEYLRRCEQSEGDAREARGYARVPEWYEKPARFPGLSNSGYDTARIAGLRDGDLFDRQFARDVAAASTFSYEDAKAARRARRVSDYDDDFVPPAASPVKGGGRFSEEAARLGFKPRGEAGGPGTDPAGAGGVVSPFDPSDGGSAFSREAARLGFRFRSRDSEGGGGE